MSDNRAVRPRHDVVLRPAVRERLASAAGKVVVVEAPGGYGKTSHVSAWLCESDTAVRWETLDGEAEDPAVMVRIIGEALVAAGGVAPASLPLSWSGSTMAASSTVAVQLGKVARAAPEAFVLVLDDVHLVPPGPAWDLVDALAANLPPKSTLVLVGRAEPPLPLGHLRVQPGVVEVRREHLALDVPAATDLLTGMGLELDPADVVRLVERTEGWPVGLRLVGLAVRDEGMPASEVLDRTGCDVYVAEYLRAEWLGRLSEDDARFVQQLSCFDGFSAELCDAVLGRSGSARDLDELHRGSLLVIPLDHRGETFRLHHLVVDLLQQELRRHDPVLFRQVHGAASAWYEAQGDLDRAFRHALTAGDQGRAEDLTVRYGAVLQVTGRNHTARRWVEQLPEEAVRSSAVLCAVSVVTAVGAGDAGAAAHWIRSARHALATGAGTREDRHRVAVACALYENAPPATLATEVAEARAELLPGIWRAAACVGHGAQLLLLGEDDAAGVAFAEGVAEAQAAGFGTVHALGHAGLALVLDRRGDLERSGAEALAAWEVLESKGLLDTPSAAIVGAVAAQAEARRARPDRAGLRLQAARRSLAFFDGIAPWAQLLSRLTVARTSLLLGDPVGASVALREAERYLPVMGRPAGPTDQLAELAAHLDRARRALPFGPSSLTTAEMRVLQFLPTNMSLGTIAERLYVSRHTVKAQSIAVYRKLGVSSRGEAVERAREAGLLPG